MLEHLNVVTGVVHDNTSLNAPVIRSMAEEAIKFLRWEYHTHTSLSDKCALHCRCHALSCSGQACFTTSCAHTHTLSCSQCNLPLHVVAICTQLCEKALRAVPVALAEDVSHAVPVDALIVEDGNNLEGANGGLGSADGTEPLRRSGGTRGRPRGRTRLRRVAAPGPASCHTLHSAPHPALPPHFPQSISSPQASPSQEPALIPVTPLARPSSCPVSTLATFGMNLLAKFKTIMLTYMGHRLRAEQQDSGRESRLASMGARDVFLLGDFMQKWLKETFREAQSERFGKGGESLHGVWAVRCALKPEAEVSLREKASCVAAITDTTADADIIRSSLCAEMDEILDNPDVISGWVVTKVATAAESDHTQDFNCSLAHFEVSFQQILKEAPWLMEARVMTDNGANYHSTGFLSGLFLVCQSAGVSLQEVWECTPGHGKDQADGIFALLKRTVRRCIARNGLSAPSVVHFAHLASLSLSQHRIQVGVLRVPARGAQGMSYRTKTSAGIASWYHFVYEGVVDGHVRIRVRRHFGIGEGKVIKWPKLQGERPQHSVTRGVWIPPHLAVALRPCEDTSRNERILATLGIHEVQALSIHGRSLVSMPGTSVARDDAPTHGRPRKEEHEMAPSTLQRHQSAKDHVAMRSKMDTTIKCNSCGGPFLSAHGLTQHKLRCQGPKAPYVSRSTQAYDAVMEERGIVEAPAFKPNNGDENSEVDKYTYAGVSIELAKPQVAMWAPIGWADHTTRSVIHKTPAQLELIRIWVDNHCRRKGIPSVPDQVKEINSINGVDTPQLDEGQVRACFSQFKRVWGQVAASIATAGVGIDDRDAGSASDAAPHVPAKRPRGRPPKVAVDAKRQQPSTRGASTASQPVMDGGEAVDFVMAMNAVAEDMEADVVMRNLSRQDLECEHKMLALSDSESD